MEPQPEMPDEVQLAQHDQDLDQQLASLVRHSRRFVWMTIALLGALVLALTGAVVWLVIANQNSVIRDHRQIMSNQRSADQRWCATLRLLTGVPVSPPAKHVSDSSREQYQLYEDFLVLREEFGCK